MITFKKYLGESDIADAVNDLTDRIKTDGYTKGMEQEVADDYDVKLPLLMRMFKQKHGHDPKDMKFTDVEDKIVDAAKRKAQQYRDRFSGEFKKYVGKIFTRPDRPGAKYVFVAWTGKDIHAITIPSQKEVRITFRNVASAQAFLEKNII